MSSSAPEQQSDPTTPDSAVETHTSNMTRIDSGIHLSRTQTIWLVIICIIGFAFLLAILWLLLRYTCTTTARAKGLKLRDGRDQLDDVDNDTDLESGDASSSMRNASSIKLKSTTSKSDGLPTAHPEDDGSRSSAPTPVFHGLGSSAPTSSSPIGGKQEGGQQGRAVIKPYSQKPAFIIHEIEQQQPSRATIHETKSVSSEQADDAFTPPRTLTPPSHDTRGFPPSVLPPSQISEWPLAAPPSPVRPLSSCPPMPFAQIPRWGQTTASTVMLSCSVVNVPGGRGLDWTAIGSSDGKGTTSGVEDAGVKKENGTADATAGATVKQSADSSDATKGQAQAQAQRQGQTSLQLDRASPSLPPPLPIMSLERSDSPGLNRYYGSQIWT